MSLSAQQKPSDWATVRLRHQPLLPAGLSDLLPPEASRRAGAVEEILARFARYGYDRVEPPLVEFEDSLLPTGEERLNEQSFRLLDPVSRRLLAVRADLTTQVARIATSRLRSLPRPLRLAYAGDVLRVTASELRPARQIFEIGAELLGSEVLAADLEIMGLAIETLTGLNLGFPLSLDLTFSQLVPELLARLLPELPRIKIGEDRDYRVYFDRHGARAEQYLPLMIALDSATGPAELGIAQLGEIQRSLAVTQPAAAEILAAILGDISVISARLAADFPELTLTIDVIENRGFDYDGTIGFSVFGRGIVGELARGGRYRAAGMGFSEPATGMTIFFDTILGFLPSRATGPRILVSHQLGRDQIAALQAQGLVTVSQLDSDLVDEAEARRQNCEFYCPQGRETVLSVKRVATVQNRET